jgi:hypothetical protein
MIDANTAWNWFMSNVVPLLGVIGFFWMVYMWIKMRPTITVAKKLIKQWGTMMVEKRENKRQVQRLTEDQLTARKKLAKAIRLKVPFDLLKDHTDEEIIAILADEDLMKGAMFLGKTGQELIGQIVNVFRPKKEKSKEKGPVWT